jgi:hypothetical protein
MSYCSFKFNHFSNLKSFDEKIVALLALYVCFSTNPMF